MSTKELFRDMLTSQWQNLNVLISNLTCQFSLEIKRSSNFYACSNVTCSSRGSVFFVCSCLRTGMVFSHKSESISLAKPLSPSLDVPGGSSACWYEHRHQFSHGRIQWSATKKCYASSLFRPIWWKSTFLEAPDILARYLLIRFFIIKY